MKQINLGRFELEYASSFEEVRPQWNELNGNPGLDEECLLSVEKAKIKDLTFYYVLVRENGKLVGLIYYQMLHFNANFLDLGLLNKWYFNFIQFFINRLQTNLLINGNLFRTGIPMFYGITEERLGWITERIAKERLFGNRVCGMMIKDVKRPMKSRVMENLGYKQMVSDVVMELHRRDHWVTLKDYQSDLKRKYRKRFEKIQSNLGYIQIRKLTETELYNWQPELERLYKNIVAEQVVRLGILNGAYFYEMKQYLKDRFEVFGLFEKSTNTLVGFSSHIYYDESMETHYIGMDYHYNNKYQLYFLILYHGLETCLNHQKKKLELGRTAKEAKASMGATPFENLNYYKINNPFLSELFNKIRKNFARKTGENWMNRQPLK